MNEYKIILQVEAKIKTKGKLDIDKIIKENRYILSEIKESIKDE